MIFLRKFKKNRKSTHLKTNRCALISGKGEVHQVCCFFLVGMIHKGLRGECVCNIFGEGERAASDVKDISFLEGLNFTDKALGDFGGGGHVIGILKGYTAFVGAEGADQALQRVKVIRPRNID